MTIAAIAIGYADDEPDFNEVLGLVLQTTSQDSKVFKRIGLSHWRMDEWFEENAHRRNRLSCWKKVNETYTDGIRRVQRVRNQLLNDDGRPDLYGPEVRWRPPTFLPLYDESVEVERRTIKIY